MYPGYTEDLGLKCVVPTDPDSGFVFVVGEEMEKLVTVGEMWCLNLFTVWMLIVFPCAT